MVLPAVASHVPVPGSSLKLRSAIVPTPDTVIGISTPAGTSSGIATGGPVKLAAVIQPVEGGGKLYVTLLSVLVEATFPVTFIVPVAALAGMVAITVPLAVMPDT